MMRFWEWRNDAGVRAASKTQDPIALETHKKWFDVLLRARELYVVTMGPRRILGHVRFNRLGETTTQWSFYMNPKLRGKRASGGKNAPKLSRLFTMAALIFAKETLGYRAVAADVLTSNEASMKLHLFLGFRVIGGMQSEARLVRDL